MFQAQRNAMLDRPWAVTLTAGQGSPVALRAEQDVRMVLQAMLRDRVSSIHDVLYVFYRQVS